MAQKQGWEVWTHAHTPASRPHRRIPVARMHLRALHIPRYACQLATGVGLSGSKRHHRVLGTRRCRIGDELTVVQSRRVPPNYGASATISIFIVFPEGSPSYNTIHTGMCLRYRQGRCQAAASGTTHSRLVLGTTQRHRRGAGTTTTTTAALSSTTSLLFL